MPIYEIAIAAYDFGPGRAEEGDIIEAREPKGFFGAKEDKGFLWLLLDSPLTVEQLKESKGGKKRDRKVDVDALVISAKINRGRMNDKDDAYQPLLTKKAAKRKLISKSGGPTGAAVPKKKGLRA